MGNEHANIEHYLAVEAAIPIIDNQPNRMRYFGSALLASAMTMGVPIVEARASEDPPSLDAIVEPVLPAQEVTVLAPEKASTPQVAPTETAKKKPFTIYLSPKGSHKNHGMTITAPVKTLQQAQEILKEEKPKTDVEVRIDGSKGPFMKESVTWQNYVKGHDISFIPVSQKHRPTFIGQGKKWFFLAKVNPEKAGNTNLQFHDLNVKKYAAFGIRIDGGITEKNGLVVPKTKGANNNLIKGMHFSKMGSKYTRSEAYGAVDFRNSSNNRVVKNTIQDVVNNESELSALRAHAVYMADGSNNNLVAHNTVRNVSGAAFDARNDSNNNDLKHNVVDKVGQAAYIDWLQEYGKPYECASHGNELKYNKLGQDRDGDKLRAALLLIRNSQDYEGKHPACDNENQDRVYTKGNTYIRSERERD